MEKVYQIPELGIKAVGLASSALPNLGLQGVEGSVWDT